MKICQLHSNHAPCQFGAWQHFICGYTAHPQSSSKARSLMSIVEIWLLARRSFEARCAPERNDT